MFSPNLYGTWGENIIWDGGGGENMICREIKGF